MTTQLHVLPENMEQPTIGMMSPGDTGYTVPWAMWVDDNRQMWLNPQYPVSAIPAGTSHMRIRRVINGAVVYKETIGDYKYTPSHDSGYFGSAAIQFIPAVLE